MTIAVDLGRKATKQTNKTKQNHVKLYLSLTRTSGSLFLNKKQWRARKSIHYSCEGRIEKSVPRDHCLSSLGKPRDAKRQSSGQIFLSYRQTHDRFLQSTISIEQVQLKAAQHTQQGW